MIAPHVNLESTPFMPEHSCVFKGIYYDYQSPTGIPVIVKKIPSRLAPQLLDENVQRISHPYFIYSYEDSGMTHYVYHVLGDEDLFTYRERIAIRGRALDIRDYIILGYISIEAAKDMEKYHQENYTLGDCKPENIVVKIGSPPQETTARHVDLETAGPADRQLRCYTPSHLKTLHPGDPALYHKATINNDLHALALTIWALASWEDTYTKTEKLNTLADPRSVDFLNPDTMRQAQTTFNSLFPTPEAPLIKNTIPTPANTQIIRVFLEYVNRLRSEKTEYHLSACYQFMQSYVNAWNYGPPPARTLSPYRPIIGHGEAAEIMEFRTESPLRILRPSPYGSPLPSPPSLTGMDKELFRTVTPTKALSQELLPHTPRTDVYRCCKCCFF